MYVLVGYTVHGGIYGITSKTRKVKYVLSTAPILVMQ